MTKNLTGLKIRHYMFILIVTWTLVAIISLLWDLYNDKQHHIKHAHSQATAVYEKDIAFRLWNARHGGVYVPVTENTRPNPYLSHIPDRDVTTTSGVLLTLINPAYMTRQVHEIMDEQDGIRGHITSLKPINPINKPDPWEIKALEAFEKGAPEVNSVEKMKDGRIYLRFMRPLVAKEPCLKCHSVQGYRAGDIRGGISISVPMESSMSFIFRGNVAVISGHIVMWLLGLGVIILGGRRQEKSEKSLQRSEAVLVHAQQIAHLGNWEWDITDSQLPPPEAVA